MARDWQVGRCLPCLGQVETIEVRLAAQVTQLGRVGALGWHSGDPWGQRLGSAPLLRIFRFAHGELSRNIVKPSLEMQKSILLT